MLRYADLERDDSLIEPAREAAAELLADDHKAVGKLLMRWLGSRERLLNA
jgi:ATP-dependent DNA helicase RecG